MLHIEEPVEEANSPDEQRVHTAELLAPTIDENVPASQSAHTVAPTEEE
jgi:hypothetical protein